MLYLHDFCNITFKIKHKLYIVSGLGPPRHPKKFWVRACAETPHYAVAQLVEAQRYKPEGRGFDSRWGNWDFSWTVTLGLTQPLTEMSTRDISWGSKGGRCVGLTTLPYSCADFLHILGALTSRIPKGLSRPIMG
jgi:hypothetical protein